jgi:hypothetical protein
MVCDIGKGVGMRSYEWNSGNTDGPEKSAHIGNILMLCISFTFAKHRPKIYCPFFWRRHLIKAIIIILCMPLHLVQAHVTYKYNNNTTVFLVCHTNNEYIGANETCLVWFVIDNLFILDMFRPIGHLQKDTFWPTWMETTSHYYHVHVELICEALFEVHRYAMLSKISHMLIYMQRWWNAP